MLPLLLLLAVDPATVDALSKSAAGRVGAAAEILETHAKILEFHAGDSFPMQSVYKLPIAMAALAGGVKLEQTVHVDKSEYVREGMRSPLRDQNPAGADVKVRELLRLAVSESDGSASDVVLRLTGGAPAVMQYLRGIGVNGIKIRDSEKRMGESWVVQYANSATPEGAIGVLRALWESRGISKESRDLLLKFMTETTTVETRVKGLLPKGTVVAHKTGSSGTQDGVTAATNDIGIVTLPDRRHLLIAVFVSDAKADSAVRDAVIAKITRAAWDEAVRK